MTCGKARANGPNPSHAVVIDTTNFRTLHVMTVQAIEPYPCSPPSFICAICCSGRRANWSPSTSNAKLLPDAALSPTPESDASVVITQAMPPTRMPTQKTGGARSRNSSLGMLPSTIQTPPARKRPVNIRTPSATAKAP